MASSVVSPARAVAFEVIRRVFEHGAYADRALHAAGGELSPRDRALATALVYGSVQRRGTLDFVIGRLAGRRPGKLEPAVLAALRLGLFQLLFMDGIAAHAAVNESVALVKPLSPRGSGLVNAVLRRAGREGRELVRDLDDRTPEGAALAHSVPEWLAARWFSELGAERARALLRTVNAPAESCLRVNTLVARVEEVAVRLGVGSRPAPGLPEGLVLEGALDAYGSSLWEEGALMPQSRGSMLVSRSVGVEGHLRVLDLCAAPGGKTTHLAALGAGRVVAVERNPGRARALRETCRRMRADVAEVVEADAATAGSSEAPAVIGPDARFDAVLVDPPCSGLGTLQSRPDIRWRASEASIAELASLQGRILAAAARVTAPGGTVVYSVCTVSAAESLSVVEGFLAAHADFAAEPLAERHPSYATAAVGPYLQLLPDREGTDGFFIARLIRTV